MLRRLTMEQVDEWFTVGKAVSAVEFLGGDDDDDDDDGTQAAASRGSPCCSPSPSAVQESLAAARPVIERGKTEYAEKYRQIEAQKQDASGSDRFICKQESNSVVIIQGATGSGKSTQLPQYVLDYCTEQSRYCNIAVTQPRKIGASSIARWICKERSWKLGGFVGYQVGLENVSTVDTRLLYMTTGVLLQKVVGAKSLTEFTHIFIDEVHERTEEMDFLLLVIRKLLRTNSSLVKIILMSASINCEEIANYFAIPNQNGLNPACIFRVEGKPYAVEEYYLDDLKHIVRFQIPYQRIDKPRIGKEMYEVAVSLIQSFDELEMQCIGLQIGGLFYVKVVLDVFPMDIVTGLCTSASGQSVSQRNRYLRYWSKLFFSGNSKSDCIAIVNAFKDELQWGRSNCIHIKKVREVAELVQLLKDRVKPFNMYVHTWPSAMDKEYVYKQRFILQVVMAGAFYPNYFTFQKCDEEGAMRELGGKDPKTTVLLKNIPPFGYLYHNQLQSQFRQCGQVKSVTYDGFRAFVEFSHNPVEGLKVLPAVYMSVKMSHLKIPIELDVHYPDDIRKDLRHVAVGAMDSLRVSVDYQKQTVEPIEFSFGTSQLLKMIPNRLLSISVTEIVEVGHFWGYRIDEKNMSVLQTLTAELDYQNLTDLSVTPHPQLLCLAPFTRHESTGYCRACILCVSGDCAEVFFVDYGDRAKVPLKKLKAIPSELQELPFQALEFQICKMRPSPTSLVCGERWSYSANQRFASLVNGYTLLVEVYSFVRSVLRVDAFHYTRHRDLVNIRDVLIEEHFAELAEESYESQQSHDLLKGFFLNGMEKEENTSMSSREEEKDLTERLLKWFCDSKHDAPTHKVTVSGPFSPYEVKCNSMTQVSQFRNAVIQKRSINSVVVQDNPEHSFEQFLVAAFLTLNENGSTVFLDETSLMPPIPGLLSLLSMLFAPAMELRVDKACKYFTGALCGLGWSQTRRAPLLPENDMELTFDVRLDVDDILEVESQHIIDQSEKEYKREDGLYQLHKLVKLNV
ncbi:UNVERIFIED_CONTAM: hypothetical protein H355_005299 [Colinus virginianus]|nr:hypothetical protein H355_005299 [Colinus virginianus]